MKLTAEQIYKQVEEMIGRSVQGIREELRDLGKANGEQRKQLDAILQANATRTTPGPVSKAELGVRAARFVRFFAASKGIGSVAADLCRKATGDEYVAKALGESSMGAGGALLPQEMSAEVIEFLRSYTVFRSMGPQQLPMNRGSLTLPYISAGATASYVGENSNVSKSEQTFGQLNLTAKKLAVLTPISNDLLRDGGSQIDQIVRDDLVAAIGEREDLAFIRGTGAANTPKGLRYWADAGNVFATAGTTLANVTTDLGKSIQTLMDAKIRMRKPGWLFAPRLWKHLFTLRDANGNLVFEPEMRGGTLFGYPFKVTQQIPVNLGGGTESELYFADFGTIVIGESTELDIAISDSAAYHDGSAVVAAFSQDQTVVRALERHDLGCRQRGKEVVVVTGVTWGA